jgi:hypothetical protein
VAVNVDPDILLVDEALAVGDLIFQHRCMHRMNHLRATGKTTILVTHDLAAVTKFCDRALLLDGGRLIEDGPPDRVVQKYRAMIFERERRYGHFDDAEEGSADGALLTPGPKMPIVRSIPNIDHRFGNGAAKILGVALLDAKGNPAPEVVAGQKVVLRISAEFLRDVARPILGYTLRDRLGVDISACNTNFAGNVLPSAPKGRIYTSDFQICIPPMAAGSYSIAPAVADGDLLKHDMCDWIDNALVFYLQPTGQVYGMLKMDVSVRTYASEGGS